MNSDINRLCGLMAMSNDEMSVLNTRVGCKIETIGRDAGSR